MKQHYCVLMTLASILWISACNTDQIDGDIKLPNHTGTWGMSIGSASYTIEELLLDLEDPSLTVETDQSLLLNIIYRDETEFTDIDQIVTVSDVSNSASISPGLTIAPPGTNIEQDFDQDLSFEYPISDGNELDSIVYNSGSIRLNIQSTFSVDVDYEFVIDDIYSYDGTTQVPLVFSGTVAAGGNVNQNQSLANHRTEALRVGSVNQFTGTFNGTLHIGAADAVTATDALNYTLEIVDIDYQTIYGYFGESTIDIQDKTIDTRFFDKVAENGFSILEPEISIVVDNSFGVPMGIDLSEISSTAASGNNIPLTGSITESPQFTRAPGVTNVGGSLQSIIRINPENSNIHNLLNASPSQLNLSADGITNFNVVDPAESRNFVDKDSRALISTQLTMPMELRLVGFQRDFDFGLDSINVKDADTVKLRIHTFNRMPFSGVVNLQILGTDGSVLHEVPDLLMIESPEIGESGKSEDPMETTIVVTLYDEGIEALKVAHSLNLQMVIDSYEADSDNYVKIFSDYTLEFKVSLEAVLNLEL